MISTFSCNASPCLKLPTEKQQLLKISLRFNVVILKNFSTEKNGKNLVILIHNAAFVRQNVVLTLVFKKIVNLLPLKLGENRRK
jgi:hypothetical protein